jgi:hypothetical protein
VRLDQQQIVASVRIERGQQRGVGLAPSGALGIVEVSGDAADVLDTALRIARIDEIGLGQRQLFGIIALATSNRRLKRIDPS